MTKVIRALKSSASALALVTVGLAVSCGSTDSEPGASGGSGGVVSDSGVDTGTGGTVAGSGGIGGGGGQDSGIPPASPWTLRVGGLGSSADSPLVATDGAGNIIVTGIYTGNIDLGGGPLPSSATDKEAFVLGLDANATHRWSLQLGSSKTVAVTGLDANKNGEVAIAGTYDGGIDLGVGALTSAGKSYFVARISAAGKPLWSRDAYNNVGISDVAGAAIDSAGNVYVVGRFNVSVDFGTPLASKGNTDGYLVKLDNSGKVAWQKALGGDDSIDWAWDVAVDSADNVYVSGVFSGTADFGGGTVDAVNPRATYVVKYDATGKHMYDRVFSDSFGVDGASLAALDQGRLLVAGSYFGSVTLASPHTPQGEHDVYVLELDAAGVPLFSRSYGAANFDVLSDVASTSSKTFYAVGRYDEDSSLLGPLPTGTLASAFLLKLTEDEVGQSQQGFAGTKLAVRVTSVTAAPDGHPIVAGDFSGQGLSLGSEVLNTSGLEVFVAKLVLKP